MPIPTRVRRVSLVYQASYRAGARFDFAAEVNRGADSGANLQVLQLYGGDHRVKAPKANQSDPSIREASEKSLRDAGSLQGVSEQT